MSDVAKAVTACGEAARDGARSLAGARDEAIDEALHVMAARLGEAAGDVLAANAADVAGGEEAGLGQGLLDRLRLGPGAGSRRWPASSGCSRAPRSRPARRRSGSCPDGLRLAERRVPVGVIGANYEARPNVDRGRRLPAAEVAQRRGAAHRGERRCARRRHCSTTSSRPRWRPPGSTPVRCSSSAPPTAQAATELVRRPGLIPLVILRGSGETTRALAAEAARHGVRTLAHADGGGVLYLDAAADPALAAEIIAGSLDRLGVCNRLNLLLIHEAAWDALLPVTLEALRARGVAASLPPHDHALGHEWALDEGHEATVTVAPATGPAQAAQVASEQTSGLAASVVTADAAAAGAFLAAYTGTGAFWNASTRLLDGFKLRGVPETGINVDHVPGPRGPVTFLDLYLRQYVVTPGQPADT